jgi:hypothetical protein
VRKATKPPSGSKTGSRAPPSRRAASAKASKPAAAKSKASKSKTAATKAKAKKSAKAKPAKATARAARNVKGCCIIKYLNGTVKAQDGVTQQQCHDIEISNPSTVASTKWQKGVCA